MKTIRSTYESNSSSSHSITISPTCAGKLVDTTFIVKKDIVTIENVNSVVGNSDPNSKAAMLLIFLKTKTYEIFIETNQSCQEDGEDSFSFDGLPENYDNDEDEEDSDSAASAARKIKSTFNENLNKEKYEFVIKTIGEFTGAKFVIDHTKTVSQYEKRWNSDGKTFWHDIYDSRKLDFIKSVYKILSTKDSLINFIFCSKNYFDFEIEECGQ